MPKGTASENQKGECYLTKVKVDKFVGNFNCELI